MKGVTSKSPTSKGTNQPPIRDNKQHRQEPLLHAERHDAPITAPLTIMQEPTSETAEAEAASAAAAAAAAMTATAPLFSSSSHASSHFPIQPLPASLLVDREVARKEWLAATNGGGGGTGNLVMTTGCRGLDEYVLLGGLERGSVVGVSAEGEDGEDEVGLLVGFNDIFSIFAFELLRWWVRGKMRICMCVS